MSQAPDKDGALEAWLMQDDLLDFLRENAGEDEFVIYAGLRYHFIHAVVVPDSSLMPVDESDLLSWNYNPSSSWGVVYSFGNTDDVGISPPLDWASSNTLKHGEQLVFLRHFEGVTESSYVEIL